MANGERTEHQGDGDRSRAVRVPTGIVKAMVAGVRAVVATVAEHGGVAAVAAKFAVFVPTRR